MHVWRDDSALAFILSHLKDRGLTPNQDKFQALGSTPNACANKPDWLREPITIESHDGVIVQARGIEICKIEFEKTIAHVPISRRSSRTLAVRLTTATLYYRK